MHNYYNLLPIILIDIFIILLFEGFVFFLYLVKQEENIISKEMNNFFVLLNYKKTQITNPVQKQLLNNITQIINNFIPNGMKQEQLYAEILYKNGMIIYLFILLIIIVILAIYCFIVVYKLGKTIDWYIIIITVVLTFGLIILIEYLYIKYVLFNKKFNNSQIELDFINALEK
jgi:hypothetical protein